MTAGDEVAEGSFHRAVQNFKRELVRAALRRHSGNKLRAAQELHISRCYLHRLLNQLNVTEMASDGEDKEEVVASSEDVPVGAGADPRLQ